MRWQRWVAWLGLFGLALAVGAYFARSLRPWGPWAFTDSAAYVTEARNWVAGAGPVVWNAWGVPEWVTHFPPGYAALLALGLRWTSNWLAVAQWWDVTLVALWVVFLGVPALRWVRPAWAVWWLAGLFLLPPVVRAFSGVMSEPPFLVLNAALFWALWWALEATTATEARRRLGVATALAAAATLTRWAGLWAVLPLAWVAWQAPSPSQRARWRNLLWAVSGPPLALLVWTAIGRWHGTPSAREWVFTPQAWWQGTLAYLWEMGRLGMAWVPGVADGVRVALFWPLSLAWIGGLLRAWPQIRRHPAGRWVGVWAAMAWAWLPFLWAARVGVRPATVINARMLTPALVAMTMTGLGLLWWALSRWRMCLGQVMVTLAVLGLLWLWWNHSPAKRFLGTLRAQGLGYTHRRWHRMMASGVLRATAALPSSMALVSNDPEGLMLWLHRPVEPMQEIVEPARPPTNRYGMDTTDPHQRRLREGGALVLITASYDRLLVPPPVDRAVRRWVQGLYPCYQGEDGGVFLWAPRLEICPYAPASP